VRLPPVRVVQIDVRMTTCLQGLHDVNRKSPGQRRNILPGRARGYMQRVSEATTISTGGSHITCASRLMKTAPIYCAEALRQDTPCGFRMSTDSIQIKLANPRKRP